MPAVGSGGEPVEQGEHGLEQRAVTPRIGARGGVAVAHGASSRQEARRALAHQGPSRSRTSLSPLRWRSMLRIASMIGA